MSEAIEAAHATRTYDVADAIGVLEAKLDPAWIKQRDGGFGKKLDYIEGARVIEILNKAFNYQWSFEIIHTETVQAEDYYNKRSSTSEPQGKYVLVLGKLTVPGLGVKMAYGSKTIVGRTSEQESVHKAAMTDALKKCATLFGVAKELYLDDESVATPQKSPRPRVSNARNRYDVDEVNALKELKAILGITDNSQLDPYVKDFSGGKLSSYKDINPSNIATFNAYLRSKSS